MKQFSSLASRLCAGFWLVVMAGAVYAASLGLVTGADTNVTNQAKQAKAVRAEKKAAKTPAKKKLTGAELYAIHCNRCHPERYPTEFTAAQWKTIMLQMRVRANLPADQSKAILKYLQEDSGTP